MVDAVMNKKRTNRIVNRIQSLQFGCVSGWTFPTNGVFQFIQTGINKKPHPYRMQLFPLTSAPITPAVHPDVEKMNTGLTNVNRY